MIRDLKRILLANAAGQAIGIFGLLLTARIYSNDVYGIFAGSMGVAGVLALLLSLCLHLSLPVQPCRTTAIRVSYTALSLGVYVATAAEVACVILRYAGVDAPAGVFLLGSAYAATANLSLLFPRLGLYQATAIYLVLRALLVLALLLVGRYLAGDNFGSLMASTIIAEFVAVICVLGPHRSFRAIAKFRKYWKPALSRFPGFRAYVKKVMPGQLVSIGANNALFLAYSQNPSASMALGAYSIAWRIISAPLYAFGASLRSTYISRWLRGVDGRRNIVLLSTLWLSLSSAIYLGMLKLLEEWSVATWLLGPGWSTVDGLLPPVFFWVSSSALGMAVADYARSRSLFSRLLLSDIFGSATKIACVVYTTPNHLPIVSVHAFVWTSLAVVIVQILYLVGSAPFKHTEG